MALAMRSEGVKAGEIVAMNMTGGPIQQMLIEPTEQRLRPATAIDAKFSLPFTTALAFVRGEVGLEDFSPASLADPAILALAARTRFTAEAGRPPAAGRLELELADGSRRSAEVTQPLGDPSKPLDWAALEAKFRRCAAYAAKPLPAAETDRLIEAVRTLETALDAGAALFPGR
jgi:2-methylcitrate dehydratase PrpD